MTKPSERIVVFVTTAQKRAITATAEDLGISVSELIRRAVLSFGATSEQVKAASIVDRLRGPRAPDALNAALQRVARGTRHAPAADQPAPLLPADVAAALAAQQDEQAAAAEAVAQVAAASAAEADAPALSEQEREREQQPQPQPGAPSHPRNSLKRRRTGKTPDDESRSDPSPESERFA